MNKPRSEPTASKLKSNYLNKLLNFLILIF